MKIAQNENLKLDNKFNDMNKSLICNRKENLNDF